MPDKPPKREAAKPQRRAKREPSESDKLSGRKFLPVALATKLAQGTARVLKESKDRLSAAMETMALELGDPQAIHTHLEAGHISAESLFTAILDEGGFKSTHERIISKNPDAPILILLEDTHGSPEIELAKLERLRKKFGIVNVAVEGWAGKESDAKRGHQLLNAEAELIEKLLTDSNYRIRPLEDAKL